MNMTAYHQMIYRAKERVAEKSVALHYSLFTYRRELIGDLKLPNGADEIAVTLETFVTELRSKQQISDWALV